uniref:Macaca fascicularis brain cDNA clone: QflA-22253, similar to human chromosome 20 open reading frame 194 (C20orf194), mRNA, RefSeq: XM_045421.3 n=1 Tax=Macaca fascicularis TaxID=9541 RepID=I7GNT2_MACFA|nr:unnamed protein product [Macaca fascicularis]
MGQCSSLRSDSQTIEDARVDLGCRIASQPSLCLPALLDLFTSLGLSFQSGKVKTAL